MNPTWRLCWKEYREQRLLWLAIVLMALVLVPLLAFVMAPAGIATVRQDAFARDALLMFLMVLSVSYGLVSGCMLFAGDVEAGNAWYLDRLTRDHKSVWQVKAATGFVLVLLQSALMCSLVALLQLTDFLAAWLAWIVLVTLQCYGCGLLASVLCRTVMNAVGVAIGLIAACWLCGMVEALVTNSEGLLGIVLSSLGLIVLAQRLYCVPDRLRGDTATPARAARGPGSLRVVAWLLWRQGKWVLALLLAASVVIGLAQASERLIWLWPLVSLLLGLVCGLEVFAGELTQQTQRFLGEQRLPWRRLWLIKVCFWLGVLLGSHFVILWIASSVERASLTLVEIGGVPLWWPYLSEGLSPWQVRLARYGHYLALASAVLLWAALGFAYGLLATQLVSKTIVALVVGLGMSVGVLACWFPSVVMGGVPLWWPLLLPALVLLLSFGLMRAWSGERVWTRRPITAIAGVATLHVALIAGFYWYRAEEIPDVGPPFAVTAFLAQIPSGNSEAAELAHAGTRAYQERLAQRTVPHQLPPFWGEEQLPAVLDQVSTNSPEGQIQVALILGWPKGATPLGDWLDTLWHQEWVEPFQRAAQLPPQPLHDPRLLRADATAPRSERCASASLLFAARALQVQARGEHAAALGLLRDALSLTRHVRKFAPSLNGGASAEHLILHAWLHWLRAAGDRPKLLEQALADLQAHAALAPSAEESCKVDYIILRNHSQPSSAHPYAPLLRWTQNLPWEQERSERLLQVVCAGRLRLAQLSGKELQSRSTTRRYGSWSAGLDLLPEEQRPDPAIWGEIVLRASTIQRSLLVYWVDNGASLAARRSQYDVGVVQLRVAQALCQAQTGQAPRQPRELVPRYLRAVPFDPWTAAAFSEIPATLSTP